MSITDLDDCSGYYIRQLDEFETIERKPGTGIVPPYNLQKDLVQDFKQPRIRLQSESPGDDDADRWLKGTSVVNVSVQDSGISYLMHRTLVSLRSSVIERLWWFLTIIYPIISLQPGNNNFIRCNASGLLAATETFLTHLTRLCGRLRQKIREMTREQMSWEFISAAMDVILVLYALGFLALSIYQAPFL